MSRVAAVAGLLLLSFDKIYDLTVNFTFPQIFIYFIIMISFVNAIRATFAYHKLAEKHID